MSSIRRISVLDQTILLLRERITAGRWKEGLPGVRPLAAELGVSPSTVQHAIRRLEQEGIVVAQGAGRSRIAGSNTEKRPRTGSGNKASLSVGVLLNEDRHDPFAARRIVTMLSVIEKAGHHLVFPPKSMNALRGNPQRVLAMLDATPADAWIGNICSREILEAVADKLKTPFLALGGRTDGIELAATGGMIGPAIRACVRRLRDLGHRRIVLVCSEYLRKPAFGKSVSAFREELAATGVAVGDYHVPDWTGTKEGFLELLRSLFSLTPPTAMIVAEAAQAVAVINFLAGRGLSVPRHLSLIIMQNDPALEWSTPALAYFEPPIPSIQRRIVRWVDACATGTQDRKQLYFDSVFMDGESVAAPHGD